MVIKLIGLGFKGYSQDNYNLFDCFIVVLSTFESIIDYTSLDSGVSTGGAISAFRGIRLLRVFKLARSWKNFKEMLAKIGRSLKDMSSFAVLLFLFMFTYSLLGMELFAFRIKESEHVVDEYGGGGGEKSFYSPRANFDSFLSAFTTIFIVLIGEDWISVLFGHMRQTSMITSLFFVTLYVLGNFIMLNLFLAILLKNFEEPEE
jgi:hypothetical protein